MLTRFPTLILLAMLFAPYCQSPADKPGDTTARPPYALAIHGGAGTIRKSDMTPEQEAEYRAALDSALNIGEPTARRRHRT